MKKIVLTVLMAATLAAPLSACDGGHTSHSTTTVNHVTVRHTTCHTTTYYTYSGIGVHRHRVAHHHTVCS